MSRSDRIAALVLAAGSSRRMGSTNKLLIPIEGVPLVRRVAGRMLEAGCEPVAIVTGHESRRVEEALAGLPVRFVYNARHSEGLGASIAAGAEALAEEALLGLMVTPGDLGYLQTETIRTVGAAFRRSGGERIVVPVHAGRRGHPVAFPIRFRAELAGLRGDAGGRRLIQREAGTTLELAVSDAGVIQDIDRPEDIRDEIR